MKRIDLVGAILSPVYLFLLVGLLVLGFKFVVLCLQFWLWVVGVRI